MITVGQPPAGGIPTGINFNASKITPSRSVTVKLYLITESNPMLLLYLGSRGKLYESADLGCAIVSSGAAKRSKKTIESLNLSFMISIPFDCMCNQI
jgi:hypothetical protein